MPRVDKRGQKYWKVREFYEDETPNSLTSSLTKNELVLLASYQEKRKASKPMSDFSVEEMAAYHKWKDEQALSPDSPGVNHVN